MALKYTPSTVFRYFKRSEFACSCGCETNKIDNDFIDMLDDAREISKIPYIITSGYRCTKHPLSKINPTSSHIMGLAADIRCVNSEARAYIVAGLAQVGFNRIGLAGKDKGKFIHVDCDGGKPSPRIWLY
tara:strand:- start:104 stop:493 length:390 start_codon:yes stop_codon:yes gene_type:complete